MVEKLTADVCRHVVGQGRARAERGGAGRGRAGQGRAGQGRAGLRQRRQGRAEEARAGQKAERYLAQVETQGVEEAVQDHEEEEEDEDAQVVNRDHSLI